MILKNPKLGKTNPLHEKMLDNKILVIGLVTKGVVETFGYTITLQRVVDAIRSNGGMVPGTVEELLAEYAWQDARLQNAEAIEVFADRHEAKSTADEYCDKANELDSQQTNDWFHFTIFGDYITCFTRNSPNGRTTSSDPDFGQNEQKPCKRGGERPPHFGTLPAGGGGLGTGF
ncbi:MAG: hypothetical protein FWC50_03115 [Planctomycetaceae bacterium]|nr:hypothetical protein [Planctomycetaceae bacterium]